MLFSSCLREGTDGCPAMRNLTFAHFCEYNSDDNYDNWIGNDVVLWVYHNSKLKHVEYIPYEQIRGGKTYSYRKLYGGNIDLVAWAVPAGSEYSIPAHSFDEDYNDRFLIATTRAVSCGSFYDIYLGTESVTGDDITTETTHQLKMIDSACQVLVTVDDSSNILGDPTQELSVLVEGVMNQMNLYYAGVGNEAEVSKELCEIEGSQRQYTSNYFGVLPSSDTQTVDVSLYYGSSRVVTVKTGEKAVAGGQIIVNISLGTDITVEVNGWTIIPSSVEWM